MATHLPALFSPFDERLEDFNSYVERFSNFCKCYQIEDDRQKTSFFIASMGPKLFSLLKSLAAPYKPTALSFQQSSRLLADRLCPQPLIKTEQRFGIRGT